MTLDEMEEIANEEEANLIPNDRSKEVATSAMIEFDFDLDSTFPEAQGYKAIQPDDDGWRVKNALESIVNEPDLGDAKFDGLASTSIAFYGSADPTDADRQMVATQIALVAYRNGYDDNRWIQKVLKECKEEFNPAMVL